MITGPYDLLNLLVDILTNWKGKPWSEIIGNILLPETMANFNIQKTKIVNEVRNIRAEVLQLQQQVDQIVYKLYGLTKEEIKIVEGGVKK